MIGGYICNKTEVYLFDVVLCFTQMTRRTFRIRNILSLALWISVLKIRMCVSFGSKLDIYGSWRTRGQPNQFEAIMSHCTSEFSVG